MRVTDPYGLGRVPERWPSTAAAAEAEQDRLREYVVPDGDPPVATAAGLDVAYADDRLVAAVAVVRLADLAVVASATHVGTPAFEYVPGLFAFRELPAVLAALATLPVVPDVLVCDGHGMAHPRRFGLACHVGVLTGLPAFGVAKTRLVGEYAEPGPRRGDAAELVDDGQRVGRVLRTQDRVKPVFVSAGHRIGLDAACRITLSLTPRYRLPETTRAADHLCRAALKR